MRKLSDFMNNNKSEKPDNSSSSLLIKSSGISTLSNIVLNSSIVSLSKSKAQKFGEEAMSIATSDEVINELSEKVGSPLEGESEDDFVNRSKSILKEILKDKLFNK